VGRGAFKYFTDEIETFVSFTENQIIVYKVDVTTTPRSLRVVGVASSVSPR